MRLNSFLGRARNEVLYYQIQGIKNQKKIYIRYQDFDFIAVLLCYLVLPKGLQLNKDVEKKFII